MFPTVCLFSFPMADRATLKSTLLLHIGQRIPFFWLCFFASSCLYHISTCCQSTVFSPVLAPSAMDEAKGSSYTINRFTLRLTFVLQCTFIFPLWFVYNKISLVPNAKRHMMKWKRHFFCVDVTSSMTSKNKFTLRMTIKTKNCVICYNCQIYLVSFYIFVSCSYIIERQRNRVVWRK